MQFDTLIKLLCYHYYYYTASQPCVTSPFKTIETNGLQALHLWQRFKTCLAAFTARDWLTSSILPGAQYQQLLSLKAVTVSKIIRPLAVIHLFPDLWRVYARAPHQVLVTSQLGIPQPCWKARLKITRSQADHVDNLGFRTKGAELTYPWHWRYERTAQWIWIS